MAEQVPDKVIDIPNVGSVAFPGTMSEDDINKAAGKLYADGNKSHPPVDPGHSWVDTAVDWLPTAGGIAGGIIGGLGGTVAGMGVGGVPGAVAGAAIGGAGGEGMKQTINAMRGKPLLSAGQGVEDMAKEAAFQGGTEALGGAVGMVAKPVAKALYQSALKPGLKYTMGAALKGETAPVVKTLLDEGVLVTERGIQKLNTLLDANDAEVKAAIAGVTADVNPYKVTANLGKTAQKFANQVNPVSDLDTVSRVGQEFLDQHAGSPMSVQAAQELKTGTYQQLKDKAFGELKGADMESQKSLARGLKEQIEEEVKAAAGVDVGPLNAREGKLVEARKALARRVAIAGNNNPMGLSSLVLNHPSVFLGALIDRSDAVKSLIARGMWREAGRAAKVSPQLIKMAVGALATAPDEE